jgi:hypothetical protein
VRSSAKGLVNGILGVKGVSFFLRDGGIYKAGSILERVVDFQGQEDSMDCMAI